MQLYIIILSDVTKIWKDICHVCAHLWMLDLNVSFGMLMEVREFVWGHVGRDFQESGERTQ